MWFVGLEVNHGRAYAGVWPFLVAHLLVLLVLILFPSLVMVPARWLSGGRDYGSSIDGPSEKVCGAQSLDPVEGMQLRRWRIFAGTCKSRP